MQSNLKRAILSFLVSGILGLTVCTLVAAQEYTIIDLGHCSGWDPNPWVEPYDINNDGVVAGVANNCIFMWTEAEGMQSIGNFPNDEVRINDKGMIAISTEDDLVLWTEKEGFLNIGNLGSMPGTFLNDMNKKGEVVGSSPVIVNSRYAFIATAKDGMQNLQTLGGLYSRATAINKKGEVVGYSATLAGDRHAFLWTRQNGMQDLGTLGGNRSQASDINDEGQVVGVSRSSSGEDHVFLWTEKEEMTDLGCPCTEDCSGAEITNSGHLVTACFVEGERRTFYLNLEDRVWIDIGTIGDAGTYFTAVNESGQIVGGSNLTSQLPHAYLWENGVMTDLNDLLPPGSEWELHKAKDINESGQIIGFGEVDGQRHGFLMTPSQ